MLPTFANTAPAAPVAAPVGTITEGQRDYLRTLMLRKAQVKGMDMGAAEASVDRWLPGLSKAYASEQIEACKLWLADKQVPAAAPAPSNTPDVPAGRYAVETDKGAINELAFYKVDRPETGRWAGFVFVKLILGGEQEQRLSRAAGAAVLAKIAVDPRAAAIRYGHEMGECGRCGTNLTNDESRAYGIGPDCRKKLGW